MIVGQVYQLRKHLRLKQEHGVGGDRFMVLNKSFVTVVDVQHIGTGIRNKYECKVRDFYKVAILADNKVGWIRQIDEVVFRQKMRLVENDDEA